MVAHAPFARLCGGVPGVLAVLHEGGGLPVAFGVDFDDVAGEVADGVAAGHPVGEFQNGGGVVRLGKAEGDVPIMGFRLGAEGVGDHGVNLMAAIGLGNVKN